MRSAILRAHGPRPAQRDVGGRRGAGRHRAGRAAVGQRRRVSLMMASSGGAEGRGGGGGRTCRAGRTKTGRGPSRWRGSRPPPPSAAPSPTARAAACRPPPPSSGSAERQQRKQAARRRSGWGPGGRRAPGAGSTPVSVAGAGGEQPRRGAYWPPRAAVYTVVSSAWSGSTNSPKRQNQSDEDVAVPGSLSDKTRYARRQTAAQNQIPGAEPKRPLAGGAVCGAACLQRTKSAQTAPRIDPQASTCTLAAFPGPEASTWR